MYANILMPSTNSGRECMKFQNGFIPTHIAIAKTTKVKNNLKKNTVIILIYANY